jgi:hypothetical protein
MRERGMRCCSDREHVPLKKHFPEHFPSDRALYAVLKSSKNTFTDIEADAPDGYTVERGLAKIKNKADQYRLYLGTSPRIIHHFGVMVLMFNAASIPMMPRDIVEGKFELPDEDDKKEWDKIGRMVGALRNPKSKRSTAAFDEEIDELDEDDTRSSFPSSTHFALILMNLSALLADSPEPQLSPKRKAGEYCSHELYVSY